jgi:hypothetical protein
MGVIGVDRHVHHPKSTKAIRDKSDQERSHQEPGSVDSRTSSGVDHPLHPFGRPGAAGNLMGCDRILEATGLTIDPR